MLRSGPKSTNSRFHIFKTAPTKTLVIADSQARHLKAGNLNIISLPGAKVRDVYNFIPPKNEFDLIILFVGGNDLFNYSEPSYIPASQIANEIIALANFLSDKAKHVFVLGIPERDQNKERVEEVNKILDKLAFRVPKTNPKVAWKFRSVSTFISGLRYYEKDKIHLNSDGLNNLKNCIKERILYKKYRKELHSKGHTSEIYCQTNQCSCPRLQWYPPNP